MCHQVCLGSMFQTGALRFTQAVRSFEKEDKEIAELAAELKRKFIPPMPRPPVFIPQDVT